MRTALIIGASGLIGKECVYQLLDNPEYTRVVAVVRKPLPLKHHQLDQVVVDFDHLDQYKTKLVADDVFCCMGTTIKVAGSQENFKKVDYEYPLQVALFALQNGASQFLLISALGANPHSGIFYNRIKGELEQALQQLDYRAVKILQPSLLIGHRTEMRTAEQVAQVVMQAIGFLFIGPLRKFKAIPSITVAKAMVAAALNNDKGAVYYHNGQLFDLGK
jgi:uncharacterized protein YbjT (DUF2867 family)